LGSWCRAGTVEARFAKRARIVLLAAEGVSNREIGEIVDMHYNQVACGDAVTTSSASSG
jgi:DNA-binding CsgD family transcriptional regulator